MTRSRTLLLATLTVTVPLLGLTRGSENPARLAGETSLRATPGGAELSGLLTGGTAVQVLDRQGDWVRVRVEGWVAASALPAGPRAEAVVESVSPAPVATAPDRGGSAAATNGVVTANRNNDPMITDDAQAVEGRVVIRKRRKRDRPGAGARVMLLPGRHDDAALLDGESGEVSRRLEEIDAELARLDRESEEAMKDSNFTRGVRRADNLAKEKLDILDERIGVLARRNSRRESAARARAAGAATADSQGFFRFPAVEPGTYTVYARFNDAENDLEWLQTVTVADEPLNLELDQTAASGITP